MARNPGRAAGTTRRRSRSGRKPSPAPAAAPETLVPAPPPPPAPPPSEEPELPLRTPEPEFAARVPAPAPEPPLPASRRVIFFDVENTSRAEHIARVIDHLAIDRMGRRTDFVAVGNWRVIGHDTARLLARHGAQLLHSAPSTGVRDWSDLRIAVTAGVWLAGARPGDIVEIVSDDRAFDAVGDVAATLGIAFRRLSYRSLAGGPVAVVETEAAPPASGSRGRQGRRRGRGGRATGPGATPAPRRHEPAHREPGPHEPDRHDPGVAPPHTAPHDEIIGVVRELVGRSAKGEVLIDTLAHALKSRGFSRTPGSPRLITRLRRIKELAIGRTGMIRLVEPPGSDGGEAVVPEPAVPSEAKDAPQPERRRRRRYRRPARPRGHSAPDPQA